MVSPRLTLIRVCRRWRSARPCGVTAVGRCPAAAGVQAVEERPPLRRDGGRALPGGTSCLVPGLVRIGKVGIARPPCRKPALGHYGGASVRLSLSRLGRLTKAVRPHCASPCVPASRAPDMDTWASLWRGGSLRLGAGTQGDAQ